MWNWVVIDQGLPAGRCHTFDLIRLFVLLALNKSLLPKSGLSGWWNCKSWEAVHNFTSLFLFQTWKLFRWNISETFWPNNYSEVCILKSSNKLLAATSRNLRIFNIGWVPFITAWENVRKIPADTSQGWIMWRIREQRLSPLGPDLFQTWKLFGEIFQKLPRNHSHHRCQNFWLNLSD